jgi:CRISPR-associated protein Cas5h
MEILVFKITGKFAHFRKYFANNTAFSFSIPPRTTMMGILASIMGLEKESYYEDFATEKLRFGVRVLTPIKKSFHRLNLLSIKSLGDLSKKFASDFRGEDGRIQTPFEVISAWNIGREDISYQIFISNHPDGKEVFERVKYFLLNRQPIFNISLGTANFLASISDISFLGDKETEVKRSNDFIYMNSAVSSESVIELKFDKAEFDSYNFVEEDLFPGDFVSNHNREVRNMNRLLFSITPNPIRVRYSDEYYQIMVHGESLNIQFVEG